MGLGETLDEIRGEHSNDYSCEGSLCRVCEILDRIQKAYEEMIASLKVLED